MAKEITPLMKRIADNYLSMENPSKAAAARMAGIPASQASSTATRIFKHPKVIEYIRQNAGKANIDAGLNPQYIIKKLMRIQDECIQKKEFSNALRALELLGKHMAMFTDKNVSEIEVKNPFATGENPAAIVEDLAKLKRVLGNLANEKRTKAAPPASNREESEDTPFEADVVG